MRRPSEGYLEQLKKYADDDDTGFPCAPSWAWRCGENFRPAFEDVVLKRIDREGEAPSKRKKREAIEAMAARALLEIHGIKTEEERETAVVLAGLNGEFSRADRLWEAHPEWRSAAIARAGAYANRVQRRAANEAEPEVREAAIAAKLARLDPGILGGGDYE